MRCDGRRCRIGTRQAKREGIAARAANAMVQMAPAAKRHAAPITSPTGRGRCVQAPRPCQLSRGHQPFRRLYANGSNRPKAGIGPRSDNDRLSRYRRRQAARCVHQNAASPITSSQPHRRTAARGDGRQVVTADVILSPNSRFEIVASKKAGDVTLGGGQLRSAPCARFVHRSVTSPPRSAPAPGRRFTSRTPLTSWAGQGAFTVSHRIRRRRKWRMRCARSLRKICLTVLAIFWACS